MKNKKILIAYYSLSGNTKTIAQKIQNQLKPADIKLLQIKPIKDYPQNYNEVVELAKQENVQELKPEIVDMGNVKDYDIIFVGTPVWCHTIATPVRTFLTKNNFEGKTIIPFCTHGGGGASTTYSDIKKYALKAKIIEGFTSYENSATDVKIKNWLDNI